MGLSVSVLLIAAGAILRWAVTASTDGVNLQTVGMILFIVGIAGAVLSLAFWSSWGGFERDTVVRQRTIVRDDPTAPLVRDDGSVVREERIVRDDRFV